jgi:hypothetical protein
LFGCRSTPPPSSGFGSVGDGIPTKEDIHEAAQKNQEFINGIKIYGIW